MSSRRLWDCKTQRELVFSVRSSCWILHPTLSVTRPLRSERSAGCDTLP